MFPLAPLQSRVNVLVAPIPEKSWLPDIGLVPDQAPLALQELTLVPVHVMVALPPAATSVGVAANASPGAVADPTVTVAETVFDPPGPVHTSVYVRVDVIELIVCLPDVAFDPDQAPDAEHPSAYNEDQLSVDDPPLVTLVGEADSVALGASGAFVGPELDVEP